MSNDNNCPTFALDAADARHRATTEFYPDEETALEDVDPNVLSRFVGLQAERRSDSDAYMLQFAARLSETLRLGGGFIWMLANDAIGERASRHELVVRNQYCHPPLNHELCLLCVMEWLLVRDDARYLLVLVPQPRAQRPPLQPHYTCATPADGAQSVLYHSDHERWELTLYSKFEQ